MHIRVCMYVSVCLYIMCVCVCKKLVRVQDVGEQKNKNNIYYF